MIRTGQVELHTEATLETLAVDVRDREAFLEAMAGIPVRSWMSVPLTARGRTFGAVSLVTSVSGRRLDERDLELARDLARRAALEVDNALLFRAEEEAQQRLAFLAEASRLLTRSLDYDRTPRRLASLAVPRLGDWCVVDLMGEDGTLRHAAVEHVDPAKVELARELGRRYPPDPNQDDGTIRVIRTGEPELYPDIPDEMLVRSARDEEHLRILRELDLRSVLIVPLTARGRTFGTLNTMSRLGLFLSLAGFPILVGVVSKLTDDLLLHEHAQPCSSTASCGPRAQRATLSFARRLAVMH